MQRERQKATMIARTNSGRSGATEPLTINLQLQLPEVLTEVMMSLLTRATLPTAESAELVQGDLFSTSTNESAHAQAHDVQPQLFPDSRPAREAPRSRRQPRPAPLEPVSLEAAFRHHVLPTLKISNAHDTWNAYVTALDHFCSWYETHRAPNNPRSARPGVVVWETQPETLAEFWLFCCDGQESKAKTASNKLKLLRRIWGDLHEADQLSRPAPKPKLEMLRRRAGLPKKPPKKFPIPASMREIRQLSRAVLKLRDDLTWPRLGTLEPWQFWWNVIGACAVHGFRPADLWPLEKKDGRGLLWEEVCTDPVPPIDGGRRLGADWDLGWLSFRMNKTGEQLVAPISPHLFFLIQHCRGLDPVRVFPIPYTKQSWYQHMRKIKEKASLSRDVSLCGQYPSASFRKSASMTWKRQVSRAAASHMLGHSVRVGTADDVDQDDDEVVSNTTEQHYNGADILREVVEGLPLVLQTLPPGLRC